MNRIKSYIVVVMGLFSLLITPSCSRRSTLSDSELAQIFHDAFLANAYTSTEGIRLDTLKLYEPIFQKYGYTTEDVQYSIGNFSLRKSARLSDVVERAISMLESRGKELDLEVAILDTVNNIAKRLTTHTIYQDSILTYRSKEDSASMMIVIEPIEAGTYHLEFDYLVDSLDTSTRSYTTKSWSETDPKEGDEEIVELDEKGRRIDNLNDNKKDPKAPRKKNQSSLALKKRSVEHFKSQIKVDTTASRLVINIATISHEEDKEYSATFKRIAVKRLLDNEEALDSLFHARAYINIFDDELLFPEP
ncbi:MAG: DUF4296 domain-containing protein [Rikenellaceae bacterium]